MPRAAWKAFRAGLGRAIPCLLLAVAWLLGGVRLAAQGNVAGRVRDFVARTDNNEKKSVIRGKNATAVDKQGKVMEIIEARVENFREDGSLDMTIEAPQCFFRQENKEASSAGNLFVKMADQKFSIEGKGFLWQPNASHLSISNNVKSLIRKTAITLSSPDNPKAGSPTNAPPAQGSATNAPQIIEIYSDQFDFLGDRATFKGKVRVVDQTSTITCETLVALFSDPGRQLRQIDAITDVVLVQKDTRATGGRALYTVEDGIIRLTNNPTWKVNDREGSSEFLAINRTNNTFHATGKVYMKLPHSNILSTNADSKIVTNAVAAASGNTSTNKPEQFIEIFADDFDYRPDPANAKQNLAVYVGHVVVKEDEGTIKSERMTVLFTAPENRLAEVTSDGRVEIRRGTTSAFGDKAVYRAVDEKMTLTGSPHWVIDERRGKSDIMFLYPKTKEYHAMRHVEMLIPSSSSNSFSIMPGKKGREAAPAAATNELALATSRSTNAPMRIRSEQFSHKDNISVFIENVDVLDASGAIQCALLTVFSGASNQVERIAAEGKVTITQKDMVATGDRAVYTIKTGLVDLLGTPKIVTPQHKLVAEAFQINRLESTFTVKKGKKFRIEMKPDTLKPSPAPTAAATP